MHVSGKVRSAIDEQNPQPDIAAATDGTLFI
jgi:hypothetical protein